MIQRRPSSAETSTVIPLQPVPRATVRHLSTAPVEPVQRVVAVAPPLVPAAVVVPLRPSNPEGQRRTSYARASAALARLREDDR